MASTDNGKQQITFRYQQEGTAEGFNKLIHGVIPTGIIKGGELVKSSDTVVEIMPLDMIISDGSTENNVTVHVRTTENATVVVDPQVPFVIATFNWENLANNYVTFESCSYTELSNKSNSIVLGRCEFSGTTLQSTFDYTRKTWSSAHYNNDFLYSSNFNGLLPSFQVTPFESGNDIGFYVGIGDAIINGKEVHISQTKTVILQNTTSNDHLYIDLSLNDSRIDIAVLNDDGTIDYIMGEHSNSPIPPIYPSNALVLAKFTYNGIISRINGTNITNIYNNNFISGSGTVGKKVGDSTINAHTLYL